MAGPRIRGRGGQPDGRGRRAGRWPRGQDAPEPAHWPRGRGPLEVRPSARGGRSGGWPPVGDGRSGRGFQGVKALPNDRLGHRSRAARPGSGNAARGLALNSRDAAPEVFRGAMTTRGRCIFAHHHRHHCEVAMPGRLLPRRWVAPARADEPGGAPARRRGRAGGSGAEPMTARVERRVRPSRAGRSGEREPQRHGPRDGPPGGQHGTPSSILLRRGDRLVALALVCWSSRMRLRVRNTAYRADSLEWVRAPRWPTCRWPKYLVTCGSTWFPGAW
jgi:hypothetical protein